MGRSSHKLSQSALPKCHSASPPAANVEPLSCTYYEEPRSIWSPSFCVAHRHAHGPAHASKLLVRVVTAFGSISQSAMHPRYCTWLAVARLCIVYA